MGHIYDTAEKAAAEASAANGICQGECDEHSGQVQCASVGCRGDIFIFAYCDEAMKEDRRRGFAVEVLAH